MTHPIKLVPRAAVLAACLALSLPRPALAQDSAAVAESLFQAGRQLSAAGKYEEACPKFEESYRLNPLPGTSLNLANCYKQVGKTASAWAQFKEAAFQARKSQQPAREAAANQEVAALEPKLSKLQINAADTPGMIIRRDGKEVGKGALGISVAVDPGPHTIEATAPGYSVWSTTISIGKEADSQTVTIPLLLKAPEGPSSSTGPDAPGATAGGTSSLRIASYAVGGAGVALLAIGSIFGALAISDANKAKTLCKDFVCPPGNGGREAVDAASEKALVSTLGIGVGAAAVGAGVVLFVLGRSPGKDEAPAKAARVLPMVSQEGGGVVLSGTF
jgi:tetratricopeptide (TPR) repeat protein